MTEIDMGSSQWWNAMTPTVGKSSNGNITCGPSNTNSSVRGKFLATQKIRISCWQVFARSTKRFLSQLSYVWVKHHRIKASNTLPLLIVRLSYDSIEPKKNYETNATSSPRLQLLDCSHILRTHIEWNALRQQFWGVTLLSIIFGDNQRHMTGDYLSEL